MTLLRVPLASLVPGRNVRSDLGDLTQLVNSLKKRQDFPLLVQRVGDRYIIIDGHRRFAAAGVAGIAELLCIVSEGEPSPTEIKRIQLVSVLHREDISHVDKANGMIALREDGLSGREIAVELAMDPGSVSKYLSLSECVEEVREAARNGLIGPSEWYLISRSPDQLATLQMKLTGASRDELAKSIKKPKVGQVKVQRIDFPLPSGHVVTVKGGESSLEDAIEVLSNAIKAMKQAVAKGITAKTFARAMKDMTGS